MAGMPGIIIRIGANTKDAIAGINKTQGRLERFAGQSRATGARIGKGLALGLGGAAVAGVAAAAAAAVQGVQAAIEDEASQTKLATALKNTTGATDDQVASMEDYIDAAQKKSGLDDGDMRTGMARLLRSTKSATRAQSLMNTAMEISAATGKPLAAVVEAMAKFNDGNAGALKRLGITMGPVTQNYTEMLAATKNLTKAQEDADRVLDTYGPNSTEYAKAVEKVNTALGKVNTIKGQGGVKWVAELNKQFDGSLAAQADTYAGKISRIGTAYDELLEAFGAGVIDNLDDANDSLGNFDDVLYDLQPTAEDVGEIVADIAKSMAATAQYIGPVVDKFNELNNMSDGILTNGSLISFLESLKLLTDEEYRIKVAVENDGGKYDSPRYPAEPTVPGSRKPGSTATPYYGTSDLYRNVDPLRWKNRADNADALAATRGATTRGNPGIR